MDDEYRKTERIRILFKELGRDYYKPIKIDSGFAERSDNYMEYASKADIYENLSLKKYLNVIRPCLRDLIDEHKPVIELNNNNNNNRAEWKIQLIIKNKFIFVKDFEILTLYIQQVNQ